MLELVIERTSSGARAGLLEDGRLVDVGIEDRDEPAARGDVFLGRVRSIDRELNAAFVDHGASRDGYLDRRDLGPGRSPIGRQLVEGRPLIVQINREAEGDKAARLTTDVVLEGYFSTLRPRRTGVEVQGDVAGGEDATELRARALALGPEMGVALHPSAGEAGEAELVAEWRRLRDLWATIEARAKDARAPACLHRRGEPAVRLLQDLWHGSVGRIVVGDTATLAVVRRRLEAWVPALLDRLEHRPRAFEATGAAEQLAAALEPEVPLEGGGRLTIEPTRALVAIDVDGAGRRAMDVDLAAVEEVARQLRLRQLGGLVVVDLVDPPSKRDRARLLDAARDAFAGDPAGVEILPLTPFGLMQIRRRRLGPDLAERLRRAGADRDQGEVA